MSRLLPLLLCLGCAGSDAWRPDPWPLRADSVLANGGERDSDLVHLELDLRLDFDGQRVSGTATSWVRAYPGGCERVVLHAQGLEIREVTDGRGRTLAFELVGTELTITLAEPLATGEEEALAVTYTTRAPEAGILFVDADPSEAGFAPEVWTQGQFEDNRCWFPAWDLPNERTTVDLSVRVGHDMRAIANGELLAVVEHGGGERTFRWRQAQRIPTYLIAIAAGRWESYPDAHGDLPLHYHVPPGTGEQHAREALGETPAMLAFFEELLDEPYPYAKYDQAIVAEFPWQGMENASITILHDDLLGGADAHLDLDGNPRLLVAHELAHQWFGDLVTCFGWSHLWLNEAWASYLELVWERECSGDDAFALWMERYAEWYLEGGEECAQPMALDWHSAGCSHDRAHHVYTKGPWVLHMLAAYLGEEAFWAATRAYLDRHADGLVTTHDFARSIFDATGRNVEGFFEQWVTLGGHPQLAVSFVEVPGAVEVTVRQVQEFGPTVPLFRFELELELAFVDGARTIRRVSIAEEEYVLRVPAPAGLQDLRVDAHGRVLMELELAKPTSMWVRQLRADDAVVGQWRAIPAVVAAARGGDADAAEALIGLARTATEPLLRQRAASVLDLDDPRAARTLLHLVAADPAARV